MASSPSQRDYSAPCPGCGAPVHFSSAQASFAVCEFCRSTVVRDGEVLRRIGSMAEVFEDYSPLRIGASGMFKRDGKPEPLPWWAALSTKAVRATGPNGLPLSAMESWPI